MADNTTPMMRQYMQIREKMPDNVVLLFRLGDFYEMFFDDARRAAPILDVALTRRNNVPMCGVPYHAIDSYLSRLLNSGIKVAVCEQVEDASAAKGIVKREVTRIITPGTATEEGALEAKRNNYLATVCELGGSYGLVMLDLSTGAFWGEHISGELLADELKRYAPSECVVPSGQADMFGAISGEIPREITKCDDWVFDMEACRERLIRHFGVHSLEGFGCEGKPAIISAAGGALYYVREDLCRTVGHIRNFRVLDNSGYLAMDQATCSNLELASLPGRNIPMSLLDVLDATRTSMGGRMMRHWLLRPLASIEEIRARHEAVDLIQKDRFLLYDIRSALGNVRDIERLIAKIGEGRGNARDLRSLGQSLSFMPGVRQLISGLPCRMLEEIENTICENPDLVDLIEKAIDPEPSALLKDGGMIRSGYSSELDELRDASSRGKQWLAEYQASEQKKTGIKNLKVRHNKVFGYYIEVSKGQVDNVPDNYVRKQTLVNAERYVTPELKEYENRIIGAQERSRELEYHLFLDVREAAVKETSTIQQTAGAIAKIDVLASLADRASAYGYVKPQVDDSDRIDIRASRHPVVERMSDTDAFIPNDIKLDRSSNQLLIITGPNMAGKSTYIRQVAINVIMAQMGSFVPAASANIGIVDRVFTRVGASDDLARGRSTFMVEMQETANILNNATPRSLIVLDEIGRGTSTFDGISIAWAVAEYLHDNKETKARTVFATHYHELTDLALEMKGVKNYNVRVKEENDEIVFLRKIAAGGSDKSYGIHVASLAGMPEKVIQRSREILGNLEEGEFGETGAPKIARRRSSRKQVDPDQMRLL